MALATDDKYRVIFALGYVGTILEPTSVNFNSIVRDRLDLNNPQVEDQVVKLLDKIALVETRLEKSPALNNVKRIGDIELDTDKGITLIRKEYNRLLNELSLLLDLDIMKSSGGRNFSVCL